MSEVHALAEARRRAHAEYELMRSLTARIVLTQQAVCCPGPLEHDERKQLAYQLRSLGIARDRARAEWVGWKRIVAKLAPAARGSVSLGRGSVSLAARGSVSLSARGSVSLAR